MYPSARRCALSKSYSASQNDPNLSQLRSRDEVSVGIRPHIRPSGAAGQHSRANPRTLVEDDPRQLCHHDPDVNHDYILLMSTDTLI